MLAGKPYGVAQGGICGLGILVDAMAFLVGYPSCGVFLAENVEKRVMVIPVGVVAITKRENALEGYVGEGGGSCDI